MSDTLFIDLETTQAVDVDIIADVVAGMKAPKNYKKQEVIDKWLEDNKESAISKTSFSGLAGTICCIGFAVNDGEVFSFSRDFNGPESDMLKKFFAHLLTIHGVNFNPKWVGHNHTEFDLRFLFQRCVINGVKPSLYIPYGEKPWGKSVFDTLYETVGNNKTGGSLDKIAKAFNLEGKLAGMTGADINQYWLDGRSHEIAEYCRQDVEICRNIYKRLKFIDKVEQK